MTVSVICALSASVFLIVLDQLLKLWVLSSLTSGGSSIMLIPGLLQLTYVENRGAAFGIFQGRVEILSIATFAVVLFFIYLLIRKVKNRLAMCSLTLIIAGGIGNLIDRVTRGFVVDFFDISPLFNFPVFNFADCCVVVGTVLLVIYIFFFDDSSKKNAVKAIEDSDSPRQADQSGDTPQ